MVHDEKFPTEGAADMNSNPELQIRAAVLNGDTAVGIHVTEPIGKVRLGKAEVRASRALRNRVLPRSGPVCPFRAVSAVSRRGVKNGRNFG